MNNYDNNLLRNKCWNYALQAFGTGYIFEERARELRCYIRSLTLLSLFVPLIIGTLVLSFGLEKLPSFLVFIAGILGIIQGCGSLVSVINDWEGDYRYSIESLNANFRFSSEFQKLAEFPPEEQCEFRYKFDLLDSEYKVISSNDLKQNIKEKEKRMGMRAALREFNRKCSSCNKVPESMKPTECPVCGKF